MKKKLYFLLIFLISASVVLAQTATPEPLSPDVPVIDPSQTEPVYTPSNPNNTTNNTPNSGGTNYFDSSFQAQQLDQTNPPGMGGVEDVGVPVDGGLSLLLVAGVGLGASRMHNKRKKKEQKNQEEK